jgi:hypothetical protein
MTRHAPLTRKEKKAVQRKKNRFLAEFYNFIRGRRVEAERIEALEIEQREKPEKEKLEDEKNEEWMLKTAEIRNRITQKKRLSNERWNRFAGTEDGGGRGL